MQNLKKPHLIFLFLLSIIISGCAGTNVPKNWSSDPDEMKSDTYGGWISVEYDSTGNKKSEISGELIAVSNDSIFVADIILNSIARKDITSARLTSYRSNFGSMSGLTVLGNISTISNGMFLIFTFPMWLIGGIISVTTQSYIPIIDYPQKDFEEFNPYSRFPQGLPAGMDRRKIKMKVVNR